jgi:hypothetical protein
MDKIAACFPDFNLEDKVVLMREDLSHAANTSITEDEERARTKG